MANSRSSVPDKDILQTPPVKKNKISFTPAVQTDVEKYSSPAASKLTSTVQLYGSAAKSTAKKKLIRTPVQPKQAEVRKIALAIIKNILSKNNDKILPRHYKQFAIRMSSDKILSQTDSDLRNGLDQAFIEHSYQVLFRFLHIIENLLANKSIYSGKEPDQAYSELVNFYNIKRNKLKTIDADDPDHELLIAEAANIIRINKIKPLELIKLVGTEIFDPSTITELTGVNMVDPAEVHRRRNQDGATQTLDFFDFQESDYVKPEALASMVVNRIINPLSLMPLFVYDSKRTLLKQFQLILDNLINYFELNRRPKNTKKVDDNNLTVRLFEDEDADQMASISALDFFSESGKSWYIEQRNVLLQRITPKDYVSSDEDNPNVDVIAADSHEVAVEFIIDNLKCLKNELRKFNQSSGLFRTKPADRTETNHPKIIHQHCQLMRTQLTADQESTFEAQEGVAVEQSTKYEVRHQDGLKNTLDQTPFRESIHNRQDVQSALASEEVLNYKLTQKEKRGYLIQLLKQPSSWARNRLIAIAVKEGAHKGLTWDKLRKTNLALKQLKNDELINLQQVQTADWQSQVEIALVDVVQYVNDEIAKATDDNRKSLLTNKLNAVHTALKDLQEQQKPVKQVLNELQQHKDIKKKSMFATYRAKTLKKLDKISIAVTKYKPSLSDLDTKQTELEQLATQCVEIREEKESREANRNAYIQLASTLLSKILADIDAKIGSKSIFITKSDKEIYKARKAQVSLTLTAITELDSTVDDMFSSPEPSQQEKTVEQQQADLLIKLSQSDAIKANRSAWACFYQDHRTASQKKLQAIAIMTGGQGYKPAAPGA